MFIKQLFRAVDAVQILELSMPAEADAPLYKQMLSTFVGPMFARCSSRIEDLQVHAPAFQVLSPEIYLLSSIFELCCTFISLL